MIDRPTGLKRAEFFTRRDFAQHITNQQEKNRLNTVSLIGGGLRGLRMIDHFNLPPREIALRKALFLSRRSARIADAAIDATVHVKEFEKMDPKERAVHWDHSYEHAITGFLRRPEIKKDPELSNQITFLQKFFSLPGRIYEARERHWKKIEKVEKRLLEEHIDPKVNHLQQLDRLVKRVTEHRTKINVFAMDACVASSIYADMNGKDGNSWSEAYFRGMEMAYAKIKEMPELVDAIAAL